MIQHFYHLYADGDWEQPLEEHVRALRTVTVPLNITVGVVGQTAAVGRASEALLRLMPQGYRAVDVSGNTGWEQDTLRLIRQALPSMDPTDTVLYAHTKGAANPSGTNTAWRQCMTRKLVRGWRSAQQALRQGADTVGCHWLTPEKNPKVVEIPYYGGNFWWATPEHLKRLPDPSDETRYHAEAWLGTVVPGVPADFAPGWPGAGCVNH